MRNEIFRPTTLFSVAKWKKSIPIGSVKTLQQSQRNAKAWRRSELL